MHSIYLAGVPTPADEPQSPPSGPDESPERCYEGARLLATAIREARA